MICTFVIARTTIIHVTYSAIILATLELTIGTAVDHALTCNAYHACAWRPCRGWTCRATVGIVGHGIDAFDREFGVAAPHIDIARFARVLTYPG